MALSDNVRVLIVAAAWWLFIHAAVRGVPIGVTQFIAFTVLSIYLVIPDETWRGRFAQPEDEDEDDNGHRGMEDIDVDPVVFLAFAAVANANAVNAANAANDHAKVEVNDDACSTGTRYSSATDSRLELDDDNVYWFDE